MADEPVIQLRGERIGLGPLRGDLLDTYLRWVNDLRVSRTLALPSRPHTRAMQERWLEGSLVSRDDVIYTIYVLEAMRPIGNIGLHDIDHGSATAEFGILIGEVDAWGQGYGTEATKLILNYGFDVLGLHNVQLECYANNPAGVRVYERAGFKHVGVRRGAKRIGRKRVDIIIMDILSSEVEPSGLHSLMQDGPSE